MEELSKLEVEGRARSALRVLGEFGRRIEGFRSDFYVSIREEIERIVDEMVVEKKITKSVIERIKSIQERLKTKERYYEKWLEYSKARR